MRAYLGLGSNLGNAVGQPPEQIRLALALIENTNDVEILATSSIYQTQPHQMADPNAPEFSNAVAAIETTLTPHQLLGALQTIEIQMGRQTPDKRKRPLSKQKNTPVGIYESRVIDIDLLLYENHCGNLCLQDDSLTLPHPRMHERPFVMIPLQEVQAKLASKTRTDQSDLVPHLVFL